MNATGTAGSPSPASTTGAIRSPPGSPRVTSRQNLASSYPASPPCLPGYTSRSPAAAASSSSGQSWPEPIEENSIDRSSP
jgi:hypothetical protein